jgi:hypothetical protein
MVSKLLEARATELVNDLFQIFRYEDNADAL